jgi:hypothetical protein
MIGEKNREMQGSYKKKECRKINNDRYTRINKEEYVGKPYRIRRKKKTEMIRREVEDIQYTVKEYRKFCNCVKNLTTEYQPRNLNVLDVNGNHLKIKRP